MNGCRSSALALVVTAAGAAAVALPTTATARGASSLPRVPIYLGPPGAGSPAVRPARITDTGDGSGFFAGGGRRGPRTDAGRLHWRSWTQREAIGSGDNWFDNCTPDCAAGSFTPYPVTLRLFDPGRLDGFRVFTRMRVTYTGRVPVGNRRVATLHITYAARDGGFSF